MNQTNLKERGLGLLASLLFHAVILFLLVKIVPPVQVPLFRQVAVVHIVSPQTMYYPRIENLTEDYQESRLPSPRIPPENLTVRAKADLEGRGPDPGVVFLRNLKIGRETESESDLFNLTPSSKSKGNFSLGIARKKSEPENMDEKANREILDFSKYNSSVLSSLRFDRVKTRRGEKIPSAQLEQTGISRQEAYDFSPWAKDVVDKIRDNWIIPPIDESIAMGEVKIFIVFGKKGDLIEMEIVKSSDFQVFDQTTIEAIRSCAPFPPLPDDFPSDRLEAYLVFQFNE